MEGEPSATIDLLRGPVDAGLGFVWGRGATMSMAKRRGAVAPALQAAF
jgi:hypothetical protein